MQTDIPLKRLTLLRAADLLPLFGLPQGELIAVETLEFPASATRLDVAITGTVVSLTPESDPGDRLIQIID